MAVAYACRRLNMLFIAAGLPRMQRMFSDLCGGGGRVSADSATVAAGGMLWRVNHSMIVRCLGHGGGFGTNVGCRLRSVLLLRCVFSALALPAPRASLSIGSAGAKRRHGRAAARTLRLRSRCLHLHAALRTFSFRRRPHRLAFSLTTYTIFLALSAYAYASPL